MTNHGSLRAAVAVTSDWCRTKSRRAVLLSVGPLVVVGYWGRCAAADTLPPRVSGRRAPSSPSAMAVAAVGRPGAVRCPLLLLLSFLLVAGPALCWNDPGECRPSGAHPLHHRPPHPDQFSPVCLSVTSWLVCFSLGVGGALELVLKSFPGLCTSRLSTFLVL